MAYYKIIWKKSAYKDLKKIDKKQIPRVIQSIESLSTNPFPEGCRKLHGSIMQYRIRVGDYRIIYQVQFEGKIIIIFYVRHRKDAYR